MYTCIYQYTHIEICTHICICMYMYIHLFVCIYIYTYASLYIDILFAPRVLRRPSIAQSNDFKCHDIFGMTGFVCTCGSLSRFFSKSYGASCGLGLSGGLGMSFEIPWVSLGVLWECGRDLGGPLGVPCGSVWVPWGPAGGPMGSLGRGRSAPKTQEVLSECLVGSWGAVGVFLVVWGGPCVRPMGCEC